VIPAEVLAAGWPALLGERLAVYCETDIAFDLGESVPGEGAWCQATLTVDDADWEVSFGLDRGVAIAMGGAMMALNPVAVADLVANHSDTAMMSDAFYEIANLAFAAMDDVLRASLGDGVHTVRRATALTAMPPEGVALVSCDVRVGDPENAVNGHMALRVRRAAR